MNIFGYLPRVRLKFLLITYAVGVVGMNIYARFKVKNGLWMGIPDTISGALVVTLGSAVFNVVMTALSRIGR